jgi:hypothetical protein
MKIKIVNNNITKLSDDNLKELWEKSFYNCVKLEKLSYPSLTNMMAGCFHNNEDIIKNMKIKKRFDF